MSSFHKQESATVSVSGQPGVDYWDYLRAVDKILRGYGARPHWGKMHFLTGEDVSAIYPRAHDFRALRRKLDPQGFYLNDHLSQFSADLTCRQRGKRSRSAHPSDRE